MATWEEFATAAPQIAEIFVRRHAAAGGLCMLATLRPDGFPRISPMEPRIFEGTLWIGGMPGTAKFRDLLADPRFALHTATVDTQVADGDAKVWGTVEDVHDAAPAPALRGAPVRGDRLRPARPARSTTSSPRTSSARPPSRSAAGTWT